MTRNRITAVEGSAALLLSDEVLDILGVEVGDEVDVSVVDGTLVLRPTDEAGRTKSFGAVIEELLVERRDVYEELAKGAE
jgi:antitoxin component of MazEF toxin-antitoxin module